MNYIYQSKLLKQLIAVIGLLTILAIGIPSATRVLVLLLGLLAGGILVILLFQNKELEKLLLQDDLTGLANRRYFEQQLHLELERAYRIGHSTTMLILDIDYFKIINDKFGHLEGDKALKRLASAIKEVVREVDLPARFGGDEFLVLLPETSLAQGQIVAEKIRKKISQIIIPSRKGNITFTVSIGMSGTEQDGNYRYTSLDRAGDELLKRADEALYQAKSKGKNSVEVWAGDIHI